MNFIALNRQRNMLLSGAKITRVGSGFAILKVAVIIYIPVGKSCRKK
ncbi:hypothetical protein OB236_38440 [Paenibacillus sp. WQ 127069]|uniref:Uncharacterized protein n=1 Tax=Paenibacillus baimaensis TaxID=2982185 RepID=A0ABT2UV82_9BACL|nr:hypothetical protein [Paenibacillus sp. WQ 127069]MCU6798021.1 hypothetical protein [Paenibacillus sp. WQ 127069]